MKITFLSLWLVTLAGMAFGPAAIAAEPPQPEVITCWYNQNEQLTGSSAAPAGAVAGVKTQRNNGSGNHAWSYTIEGRDASACPAKLPVGSVMQE
jgi:hypothetical protein